MIALLYIEFKNSSYILISSRENDNKSNDIIDSYICNSKVIRKLFIIIRLIDKLLIITIIFVLNVIILILDITKCI